VKYDLPSEILVEEDGPIRIVTLNRPEKLNAANEGLHRGIAIVWRQISSDPTARAVVLTGAGKLFCAGGDLDYIAQMPHDVNLRRRILREEQEIMEEMVRFPLPIVAAVNGGAVGLGCSLAVLCDVVLIADDAFMADPHVSVGLVAGDGGAAAWPLMTSLLKAKEYLLTGDRIPAGEAVALGLANRVVAAAQVRSAAIDLARRLAAQPRQALEETKHALNMHLARGIQGVMEFAIAAEGESMIDEEHQRRIAELRQKRRRG
jgi:enoyl-CoA hydratase